MFLELSVSNFDAGMLTKVKNKKTNTKLSYIL